MDARLRGVIAADWVRDALAAPTFRVDQTGYPGTERVQDTLLDVDQILFEKTAGSPTTKEWSGLEGEWRGRFWLPTDGRVEPGRRPWLVGNDGRAGRSILDRFGEGSSNGDVAVYQGATPSS
jgi:hypothetical protein